MMSLKMTSELIGETMDWDRFTKLNAYHGITALTARNLHNLDLDTKDPIRNVEISRRRI